MSKRIDIKEYESLWTTESKDHVIVSLGNCDLKESVVFNVKNHMAIIIEDDDVALEVMKKMLANKVPRVEHIPK